ncbi:WLM-domain-containing protein [Tothia fuscella]|uniref:WLM-domain-containing protein n=1 Tax=Tothia fuscella TaxID=1048955 RepID=A0A9P4P1Z3_9PEZI|nr:WLM-domain-containing protein [Tothia fuscella]
MREQDGHFGEYVHDTTMPNSEKALHTLRKIASCVKPIMRKRGWRVGELKEFYPIEEKNLLGVNQNHGAAISLRLRQPYDKTVFLDFDRVLDTMLHELVHNVIGPHDESFQRLWDELREEWQTLKGKGFTGEGFLGKGNTIGGKRVPQEELRRRARVAAQERLKENQKSHPGHILGGGASRKPRDVRSAAAEAAARREAAAKRAAALQPSAYTSSCATGTKLGDQLARDALKNGFRTKAEMDNADEAAIAEALVDLYEQDEINAMDPPSEGLMWNKEQGLQPIKPSASSSKSNTRPSPSGNVYIGPPSSASPSQNAFAGPSRPAPPNRSLKPAPPPRPGQPLGTQYNPSGRPVSRLVLEAEAQKRKFPKQQSKPNQSPSSPSTGNWCGPMVEAHDPWSCLNCTLTNDGKSSRCDACDSPRGAIPPPRRSRPGEEMAGPDGVFNGWYCKNCGEVSPANRPICRQCGRKKDRT